MNPPRILIVSATAGAGHVRAGQALHAACIAAGLPAEHADVLELAPRWVRRAYAGGFEMLASRAPSLWRGIYHWSDGAAEDAARWGEPAARTLFRAFRHRLMHEAWDYCLCTHFLPAQLAAGRAGLPPFGLAVTDFELHRYWVQPRVADTFVASLPMATALRRRLPHAAVRPTGIPIDPVFADLPARSAARAALGLDRYRPLAVVMGGGLGIGVVASVHATLRARVQGLQVVAVCGRNREAAGQLRVQTAGAEGVRILGYVDDIERLFAAADVVITKPGGLTSSEVLAAGTPLLLTRALPGHETANVRYLTGIGAALHAPHDDALAGQLHMFFGDASFRRSLAGAAARAGKPHAAAKIIDVVRGRFEEHAAA